jgi:ferredoxin-type protein NapG
MPTTKKPRLPGRRQWLGSMLALGALGAAAKQVIDAEARGPRDPRALRPPGALPERDFLGTCVRCGLCADACPYETLHMAATPGPAQPGTPFFVARDTPCFMCDDVPCQRACPTGALGPRTLAITDARMGLANVNHPERCYSMIGAARCDACWRACPIQDRAITMKRGATSRGGFFTPTVDASACTGCGLCEKRCIAEPAAITVVPLRPRAV